MSETGNSGGNTTVIENVEFRATAPSVPLPGLDNAQRKLEALGAALKRVQSQLAGLSTRTMFKLSAKQYEDVAEKLLASKGMRGLGVGNIARKLGFGPEAAKDVRATADQMIAEVHKAIAKIEREIKNNPRLKARAIENRRQQIRQLYAWLPFEGPRGGEFRDPKQAGMFFGGGLLDRKLPLPKGFHFSEAVRDVLGKGYAGAALANHERGEAELRAILRGTVPNQRDAGPNNLATAVQQTIKQAKQATATAQQTAKDATKVSAETKKATKKEANGGAAKGTMAVPVAVDESGGLVEEKRTTYPGTDTPEKVVHTRRTGFGKTVTTTTQGDSTSQMERTKVQERLAKGFDQSLNALANEYARHLHIFDPRTARRVALSQAGAYYKSRPEYAQLGFRDRMAEFKGQLDEKLAAHQHWQLAQEARSDLARRSVLIGRTEEEERADLAMADYKQNQAEAGLRTQLTPEEREKARLAKKANQALQRQLSRWDKQAGLDDLEVLEQKRRLNRKQDVEAHEQALVARGARLIKEDRDLLTNQVSSRRYAFDEGGYGYVARMDYDGTGGATARLKKGASTRTPQTRLQNAIEGLSGENMLANLIKVSSWSAAVMVLYKSAELANYSLKRLEQTGMEMAHLDVVFRKVGGTSQELTMDIIKLAGAQGRQTSEAMESAVAWARLGGDRKEINEEVRVSAVAANIANMHMGETTKQLQSLMHIYHLEANDLDGTLSGLVNTTLKYNVTLEEMFTGLDRSAAAAKVAGVSLAELQGMLGVLVGATGQTGATTGNALKYIFQELNKSDVQQQLREKFHVEALGNNLEQKPAGQILGELSGIWGTLGTGERGSRSQQALAGLLGGRFNAARVPIVIQEYPQILKLAIDEQLSLNSAQEANARILDTLKANVAGLHAEYDRLLMSTSLLSKGSFTAAFAKNVMHDIASPREAYPWVGWMADHYPFMEKLGPQPYQGMNDRQRIEAFLNQGSGIGRFYDAAVTSLGTLSGQNLPWSPFKRSTPGLFEIYNYAHDADVLPGQADFAKRMDDLKRRANAGALQGQAMGLARQKLENGSMTQHDASAFAAIMRGMPGGDAAAADFLNNWQNNKPAALALVKGMGAKAFQAKENIITRRGEELKQNQGNMEAELAALDKKAKLTADETKRQSELNREVEKSKEDIQDNTAAWEELQGSVENVQVTQQKYLNLLKTQEELQAGIEQSFKLVQAHSPAQELAQDIGALTAQVEAAKKAIDDFDESEGGIAKMEPEAASARGKLVERWKSLQADLAGAQARQPQAEMLTAMQRGIFGAELGHRAADFGLTEADKLLNQRAELTKDIARTEEQLAAAQGNELQHAELQGRLAKDNMLLYENQLALRQRAADVEKEIAQLAIDQNREFARSFFGSGPAEMLRKLAAFRVASQGGVSMGQLFMMSPGMRQDVGQLTGMNPDMMRLLMERNRLQGLPGFAEGGYTGDGNPNEVAGVVHKGEYVIPKGGLNMTNQTITAYVASGNPTASTKMPVAGATVAGPRWVPLGTHVRIAGFTNDFVVQDRTARKYDGRWDVFFDSRSNALQFGKQSRAVTVLPGFAGGGYTGDGPADEVAGVVHRGEFVIPRDGTAESGLPMDDYAVRKTAERNRLPHGSNLEIWRNYYQDKFEEDNARKKAADATLPQPKPRNNEYWNGKQWVSLDQPSLPSRLQPTVAVALGALAAGKVYALVKVARTVRDIERALGTSGEASMKVASRAPISKAVQAARARYAEMVAGAERSAQFGEMFRRAHGSLMAPGSRLATFASGRYLPQGVPLDDFGHGGPLRIPTQASWGATPTGTTFSQAVNNVVPPARGLVGRGWTAARGILSNPNSWANLGHGVAGAGVTMGLDWAGGKINPALGNSDTYGGAAYGLFTEAAGGAVAGMRGGPLGMGIGAVAGMAIGTGMRLAGGLRGIGHQWVDSDKTNQQVSAAQQELMRWQREWAEDPRPPTISRLQDYENTGERESFWTMDLKKRDADSAARSAATMSAADAEMARWDALKHWKRQKPPTPAWDPKYTNPATGLPYDSGRTHILEGRPPRTTGPRTTRTQTQTGTNGNHGMSATMPTMHIPISPPHVGGYQSSGGNGGGNDAAVRSAAAALEALAASSGRLQAAFEGLARRVDTLFRQTPTLNFTAPGQQGGWYPGRQS